MNIRCYDEQNFFVKATRTEYPTFWADTRVALKNFFSEKNFLKIKHLLIQH